MLIGIIWLRYSKNIFITKVLREQVVGRTTCSLLLFIGPELGDLEPHNIAFDNTFGNKYYLYYSYIIT